MVLQVLMRLLLRIIVYQMTSFPMFWHVCNFCVLRTDYLPLIGRSRTGNYAGRAFTAYPC